MAERSKFHNRRQQPGETIVEYIVILKHLAASCKFGTFLEDALRDRLISGVSSEELRQKLISKDITFIKAQELALKHEEANKLKKFVFGETPGLDNHLNAIGKRKFNAPRFNSNSGYKPQGPRTLGSREQKKFLCTRWQ